MPEQIEHPEEKKEDIQLVVFKLGNEEYGVEIHEAKEIIKKEKITRIPNTPEFVEGIINLRGKIVVVINLLKRFGSFDEEQHKGTHVIISEVEGNSFGILVDSVTEVLRTQTSNIKKAPGIIAQKIHADYLKGVGIVGEKGDRLLILLDLAKVLSEKDLVEMASLTKGMQEKATAEQKAKEDIKNKPKITEEEIEKRFKEHFKEEKPVKHEVSKGIDKELIDKLTKAKSKEHAKEILEKHRA